MINKRFLAFAVVLVAADGALALFELSDEKTPYDYVKDRLDAMQKAADTGLPIAHGYEVEESEDYPDHEGAASTVYNAFGGGLGGFGTNIGQYGGIGPIGYQGGIGQGIGLGVGGVGVGAGGVGVGGGGLHGLGVGGVGVGGLGGVGLANGIGLQGGGIGLQGGGIGLQGGGIGLQGGGIGGGLFYQPVFGIGGGFIDKKAYDAAQKKAGDENLEKFAKKAEEEAKHGQEGFQQGAVAAKSEKGDSSFYKDEEAKKKAAGDEKFYEGAQKFDKAGANEQVQKTAKSHKKGHSSKGFKSSSSKNEEEKTETFYDEAHDEADAKNLGHNQGSFGENAASGFKGAHEEKVLDATKGGKEGHHLSAHKADESTANKGGYAQNGYKGGAEQLEKLNNLGAHSIHGHQESAGEYQKKPYGILPIHVK